MEDEIRDYSKLVNYFQKLLNYEDSTESSFGGSSTDKLDNSFNRSSFNSSTQVTPSSSGSNRLLNKFVSTSSSSSSSLVSLPSNSSSFQTLQHADDSEHKRPSFISNNIIASNNLLQRPDKINLSLSCKGFQNEATPSPGFLGSFNLTTPMDEQGGRIYMKQKMEDDSVSKTMTANKKRVLKKVKSKSVSFFLSIAHLNFLGLIAYHAYF